MRAIQLLRCILLIIGFIKEEKDEDSAPLMVLEFMQYGDLASFMAAHRCEVNYNNYIFEMVHEYTMHTFITFRPTNDQPSVIGEKKFYAFATDVSVTMKLVEMDLITPLSSGCKGVGVFVK